MASRWANQLLRHVRQVVAPRAANLSDGELLQRFVSQHDVSSFSSLVERHGPLVWHVCRRVLSNWHDAEDAFQATFLVLSRKAASIRRGELLAGWLHGVAYRTALKAREKAAKRRRLEGTVRPESVVCRQEAADPLAELSVREVQEILDQELARLPEKHRVPLLLCCLEGLAREEAARQLGWPPSLVKTRLEEGRERLRQRLTRRGLTLPTTLGAGLLLVDEAVQAGAPRVLVLETVRALAAFSAAPVASALPLRATLLAEEVLKGFFLAKLKMSALLGLIMGLLLIGVGTAARGTVEENDPEPTVLAAGNFPQAKTKKAEPTLPLVDAHGDALPAGAIGRIGSVRWRHDTQIYASVLSPDGKRLATASGRSVAVWDLGTGRVLHRFRTDHGNCFCTPGLTFSPDGKRLGFVHGWHTTLVWDLETNKEMLRHGNEVQGSLCRFTPDGKHLMTTDEKKLWFWDPQTWKAIRSVPVQSVSLLSPDTGTYVRNEQGVVAIVDTRSGIVRARLSATARNDGIENGIAFAPGGKSLAAVDIVKKEIQVWDLASAQVRNSFPLPESTLRYRIKGRDYREYRVCFSRAGRTLLLGTSAGTVHRWDLANAKELPVLGKHAGLVAGCHELSDGKTLVSTGADGMIRHWDVSTGRELTDSVAYAGTIHAALSPRSSLVMVGDGLGRLELWDGVRGKRRRTLRRQGPSIGKVAFSADGKNAAVAQTDSIIQLWRMPSCEKGKALHVNDNHNLGYVNSLDFTPDGKRLRVSAGKTRLWDLTSGAPVWGSNWSHSAFSPDGTAVVAWWGQGLLLLDAVSGRQRFKIKSDHSLPEGLHTNEIMTFSPDGKRIAASLGKLGANTQGHILLCDAVTGRSLKEFPAADFRKSYEELALREGGHRVESLAFSPDGKWLASGATDASVRIWETLSAKELLRLEGHEGTINTVAFAPDGRTVFSAGADGQAYIWDLRPHTATPPRSLEALWADLSAADARAAFRAVWALADAPEKAARFLRTRIAPVQPLGKGEVEKLLAALDSESFAERQAANKALADLGDRAVTALRQALSKPISLEKQRRVQALLDARQRDPTAVELRLLRAIQTLEFAATPHARAVLAQWSHGAAGTLLTEEARASLQRLARRDQLQKDE